MPLQVRRPWVRVGLGAGPVGEREGEDVGGTLEATDQAEMSDRENEMPRRSQPRATGIT
ncbi:MAG: hypothetical protein KIT84_38600 [Labilithrix sp.]|nr:hypothetical protein [Labilithrix sp.]MCW5816971.1 hypothetical protein [Labilithrix sp.]